MQVQKNIGIDKIAYLVSGNNALLTTFKAHDTYQNIVLIRTIQCLPGHAVFM
jgi:hypothetical protein